MWDLERTLSSLVGRCLHNLYVGPRVSKTEATLAKWLDADLFRGGVISSSPVSDGASTPSQTEKVHDEELAWLVEMAEGRNTTGSAYQLFVQKNQQLPDMFDRFGGEVLDDVMRFFVAVTIRHLQLARIAMKQVLCLIASIALHAILTVVCCYSLGPHEGGRRTT